MARRLPCLDAAAEELLELPLPGTGVRPVVPGRYLRPLVRDHVEIVGNALLGRLVGRRERDQVVDRVAERHLRADHRAEFGHPPLVDVKVRHRRLLRFVAVPTIARESCGRRDRDLGAVGPPPTRPPSRQDTPGELGPEGGGGEDEDEDEDKNTRNPICKLHPGPMPIRKATVGISDTPR